MVATSWVYYSQKVLHLKNETANIAQMIYEYSLILHSYLAYVVLAILFIAVANAIMGMVSNQVFTLQKDFRICLFALILTHMQLVLGLLLYFVSPMGFQAVSEYGMGGLEAATRLLAVEHPFINIVAVVLITIGWSRHKKFMEANKKFRAISIFYGLGLLLIMSRIPWGQWFG